MSLTRPTFLAAIETGAWRVLRGERVLTVEEVAATTNPHSYNVSLQSLIFEVRPTVYWDAIKDAPAVMPIDLHDPDSFTIFEHDCTDGLILQPGTLYLAAVAERVECDAPLAVPYLVNYDNDSQQWQERYWREAHFYQVIDGRSTPARVGLSCHQTAGYADYGFRGCFTLELTTVKPLVIRAGDQIAQISFHELSGEVPEPYSGAYVQQEGPRPACLGVERMQGEEDATQEK